MPSKPIKKGTIISISDIHIGDNSIACWYNNQFHEPYLTRILEYIISQKDNIKELVILGDLFDFWTYPPNVQPPSITDILKANSNLFQLNGIFDKVVTALEGNVSYLAGNHDINITQADLDEIPLSNGYRITKRPDKYVTGNCLFTHGHLFTIFNAPDPNNPVPLGHFVTRLLSYSIQQNKVPAWKIEGFGAPSYKKILSDKRFLPVLNLILEMYAADKFDASTVERFVDIWVQVTKFPEDGTFKMADGSTKTIDDVKKDYANLFTNWVNTYGIEYVQKSIYTDAFASNMAWFTQQDALKNNVELTITGHTHYPTSGVEALVNDVNCGYECFAEPESQTSRYTFVEIKNFDEVPDSTVYQIIKSDRIDQKQLGDCKIKSTPFVTQDGWVWFQGTNNKLMKMKTDGSEITNFGLETKSTPFVTQDGWVWFQGTNNKLMKMKTDGSEITNPREYVTSTMPFVTQDGWVWFSDCIAKLTRMKTDGSIVDYPGITSALSTPFVTQDGWVWFQGTNNKLMKMKTDGSEITNPREYVTSTMPFVTQDGWVWFSDCIAKLTRMKTDGSIVDYPGITSALSTPFVTQDGWVWFQGTNNKLMKMKTDGSEITNPGNNYTKSTPFVSYDTTYFEGTDDTLWSLRWKYDCNPAMDIPLGSIVFGPFASDYSVYIRIINMSSITLQRSSFKNEYGKWVRGLEPAVLIVSGSTSGFWLQDNPGLAGTAGSVTYTTPTDTLALKFGCPLTSSNYLSITGSHGFKVSYKSKVANQEWYYNQISETGHPLSIVITIG
ncbi:DUF5050 domain-containing protein [Candidatus Nitrosocosmicus franklandus]|nr:DUF5050 domain-containing protein [Candidatus Nitrosocosmicus franklandus]